MRFSLSLIALLSLAALFTMSAPVPARAANDSAAEAQVREVVERFRTAIIARDGGALRELFLPEPQAWISVAGESLHLRALARDPSAKRINTGSYERFAEFIEASRVSTEEVFSNVDVRTDGAFAAVTFDFVFLDDGKETNRGLEAWHLVKTGDGWKIVSLIYSSQLPS